jgi:S-adenosylmethionine synthetase
MSPIGDENRAPDDASTIMNIELSPIEAEAVRDLLKQRILELDWEINRTDRHEFKRGLQQLDRTFERALDAVSAALGRDRT